MRHSNIMIALALVLVACGEDQGGVGTTPDSSPSPTPSSAESSIPEDDILGFAVVDLAARKGIESGEIEVEAFERGVWSDGSLGCPEDGAVYPQVITVGSRITLRIGSELFYYHQGGDVDPFLCESPDADAFRGQDGDVLLPPPGYDE